MFEKGEYVRIKGGNGLYKEYYKYVGKIGIITQISRYCGIERYILNLTGDNVSWDEGNLSRPDGLDFIKLLLQKESQDLKQNRRNLEKFVEQADSTERVREKIAANEKLQQTISDFLCGLHEYEQFQEDEKKREEAEKEEAKQKAKEKEEKELFEKLYRKYGSISE